LAASSSGENGELSALDTTVRLAVCETALKVAVLDVTKEIALESGWPPVCAYMQRKMRF
jgi:hypothetical protein